MTWARQVAALVAKELRQLLRDHALLGFVIYVFTFNIVLAAGGVSFELNRVPVIVNDADGSQAARDLTYRFQPPYFSLRGEARDPALAMQMLDNEEARVLLQIPHDFTHTLNDGYEPATVQLLIDASHANSGYLASSYAGAIASQFGTEWSHRNLARAGVDPGRIPHVEDRTRYWYNPDLNETWFHTVAELTTMMTVICILLPAAALVREKERGTIEQLLVSPVSPFQVMLAKVISMEIVMLAGVAVALFGIMQPIYHVPVRGSLTLFFALTSIFAFTNAGLGLAAGTFARNTGQTGLLVILIVMPIVTLSGTWTPLESMPDWLRTVMTLSPLRHFVDIIYSILLRGAGFMDLWQSVAWMIGLGALLFLLGLVRFRRQFA
jgi:ABC-2 type transport system permease protein